MDGPKTVYSPIAGKIAKPSTTPADTKVKLVKDDGVSKFVDQICFQSMAGSLLYAATRPDIS